MPGGATRLAAIGLIAGLAVGGCSDTGPRDPVPGPIAYRLVSPAGDEGALLFRVAADRVTQVSQAAPGGSVVTHVEAGLLHVAVVSRFGGPLRFEVQVADTAAPPELTLVQVVGPNNERRSAAGYALEVVP